MAFRLRSLVLALAVSSAAALVAVPAVASDTPPSQLHLVGDHWTAWNPPTDLPADAKVHTVVKGDTLWALAQTYLGNPYLWPQIWEKNQYILDAHWIYPGDPIVVGVEVKPAAEAIAQQPATSGSGQAGAGGDQDAAGRRLSATSVEGRRQTPVPLGSESDIHCTGFLSPLEEVLPWTISGTEYDELVPRIDAARDWRINEDIGLFGRVQTLKYELSMGDVVYIEGGRASGLSPGMVLIAVEARDKIRDPHTREALGRYNAYLGRVRVLTALEDRSIGEVVQNCEGLHVGARMKVFEPEPVPLARLPLPRPVNDPTMNDLSAAPRIVYAESDIFSLGQDHVVFIDRGENEDVYPGDLFTIYRPARAEGGPPIPVGELGVLSVRPHSATAKILQARYPVYVGDRLERH